MNSSNQTSLSSPMNRWTFAFAQLRFSWRSNLAFFIALIVAISVTTGALFVGDSVRSTLKTFANQRIGSANLALVSTERFPKLDLIQKISNDQHVHAPILYTKGLTANDSGSRRITDVQIFGVNSEFFKLAPSPGQFNIAATEAFLNERLASELGVKTGDEVLIRCQKPSLVSRELSFVSSEETTESLRVTIARVITDDQLARFSLQPSQLPPRNIFVNIEKLGNLLGRPRSFNLMLTNANDASSLSEKLRQKLNLTDLGFQIQKHDAILDLTSERVFLDPAICQSVASSSEPSQAKSVLSALNYFVNEIRSESAKTATPYSFISAVDATLQKSLNSNLKTPLSLADDEICISDWLAQDLALRVGDVIDLEYYLPGDSGTLTTNKVKLKVIAILPLKQFSRLPRAFFPGLSDKNECREWDSGLPIDLDKIRDKDEQFWKQHKATPKACISLTLGQKLWKNQFGSLTNLAAPATESGEQVISKLILDQSLSSLGLNVINVRAVAQTSASGTVDFGGLFIGLGLFIIVSALILVQLVIKLNIEEQRNDIETLSYLGWTTAQIQWHYLRQFILLYCIAIIPGILFSFAYRSLVLAGLTSIWASAVNQSSLIAGSSITSAMVGILGIGVTTFLVCYRAIPRTLNAHVKKISSESSESSLPFGWSVAALLLVAITGCLIDLATTSLTPGPLYFGAGVMALITLLTYFYLALNSSNSSLVYSREQLSFQSLRRRPDRSMAVVIMLALGVFMVSAMSANKHSVKGVSARRDSGTGGFSVYAETSMPIYTKLNTPRGIERWALPEQFKEIPVTQAKVLAGGDASCLNLNKVSQPTILGLDFEQLAEQQRFSISGFDGSLDSASKIKSWNRLTRRYNDGAIPVCVDGNTLQWALGKSLGDTIEINTDSSQPIRLRFAATLNTSIFQGRLLVDQALFEEAFPNVEGFQVLLFDFSKLNPERSQSLVKELQSAFQDRGWHDQSAPDRLASFLAIENTYLTIFQSLGFLALLLASSGMAIIVWRNLSERAEELRLLNTLGYSSVVLQNLIFREHALLATLGFGIGLAPACLASIPVVDSQNLVLILTSAAGILAITLGWIHLATETGVQRATTRPSQRHPLAAPPSESNDNADLDAVVVAQKASI